MDGYGAVRIGSQVERVALCWRGKEDEFIRIGGEINVGRPGEGAGGGGESHRRDGNE